MKQYKYNRVIAVILCMILSISAVANGTSYEVKAAEVTTTADGCYYMETMDSTPLRAEPSKKAAKVDTLPAGTLVYVIGTKVNSYGHIWFQIAYYDKVAFCYGEHLTEHVHDYAYNDTDDESALKVCECGAIDPSGVQQTEVVLTAGSAMLAYAGITVIAAILASRGDIGTATKDLVYGSEEIMSAVGVCAVRYVDKLGHYIPIRINEAGVAISITVDEFRSYIREKHADTDSSDSDAKFYPAMLLSSKGSDSLFVPLWGQEMNLEQACDYLDAAMAVSGSFGNYWDFAKEVRFCNVYTTERADAEMLCQKVVECPKNAVVTYGTSNPLNPGESETNAAWSIAGSYEHFHLHNAFERGHKACTHIFFGEMLDRLTKSVYSF